ncbi:type VI secretion system lipoprotein TssJ [Collimonas sp. NPDC087041]|uniref:type VI secretion system lipoprotein TssJ n=1 Tax=Collimonas sp. NPDC087041 TaxID=3363960 RepID=UPI0038292AB0
MNSLRTHFRRRCLAVLSSLLLLLLVIPAIGQAQVVKEPTKLDITIHATDDVNPTDQGQAAPIMVRVYELKSDETFKQADFFTLQNTDKAVLGADMLVKDEFILRPGDSKTIRRASYADTAVIGVLAAYRDLPNATWREVYKLSDAPEAAWYRSVLPSPKAKLNIELRTKDINITEIK